MNFVCLYRQSVSTILEFNVVIGRRKSKSSTGQKSTSKILALWLLRFSPKLQHSNCQKTMSYAEY